jgi:hypothetical protein
MGLSEVRPPAFKAGFPKLLLGGIAALVGLICMFCPWVAVTALGFWLFVSAIVAIVLGGLYETASLILGGRNDKGQNGPAFIAMAVVLAALVASPTIRDVLAFTSDASRALIETPAIIDEPGQQNEAKEQGKRVEQSQQNEQGKQSEQKTHIHPVTRIIQCWRDGRTCPSLSKDTTAASSKATAPTGSGADNDPAPNVPVDSKPGPNAADSAPRTAAATDIRAQKELNALVERLVTERVEQVTVALQSNVSDDKAASDENGLEDDNRQKLLRTRTTSWIAFFTVAVAVLLLARVMRRARIRYEGEATAPPDAPPLPRVIISYPAWVALCVYAAILLPAAYFSVGSLLYLNLDAPKASLASVSEALVETRTRDAAWLPDAPPPSEALTALIAGQFPKDSQGRTDAQAAVEVGNKWVVAIESGRNAYEKGALESAAALKMTATGSQFEDYQLVLVADYSRVLNKARQDAQPCLRSLADLVEVLKAPASTTESKPILTGADGAQNAVRNTAVAAAHARCNTPKKFPDPPAPMDLKAQQQSFPGVLYGWLAQSSNATVLIVGLIGFGLFGAAIRTMGKPNENLVAVSGTEGAAGVGGRPTASQEFALTSNTAKILVQGLGAAFTVFLSQAGTLVFTTGGKPNPYGLLLACFVGAVFAEEIWVQMAKLVSRFKEPSGDDDDGQNGGAPSRTPPATPNTGVQEPAPEAEADVPSTATETEAEVAPAPQDAEASADAETVEDAHEDRTETGTGEPGPDGGQPSGEEADPDEPADTAEALTIPSRPEGT